MNVGKVFGDLDTGKIARLGRMMFYVLIAYLLFSVFVFYFGGILGIISFVILFSIIAVIKFKSRSKAIKRHEKLVTSGKGDKTLTFSLKVAGEVVIVDFGKIQLACSTNDKESFQIMLQDVYIMLQHIRNRGKLPPNKLESEVIADYVLGLGLSVGTVRDIVQRSVLADMHELMDYGYFNEYRTKKDICSSVRGTAGANGRRKYDDSVISRVIDDVEKSVIMEIHELDNNVRITKE